MLCGAVPLVPAGTEHHLQSLVAHGTTGFHCANADEFGNYARLLESDVQLRLDMSERARKVAESEFCDAESHRASWRRLFYREETV
jgi:hypothetical protein